MIPVAPAAEPPVFEKRVRSPGNKWLRQRGLEIAPVLPSGTKIPSYWTKCLPELMAAYSEVCAYASLRIHPVTGASTVEHFAPKSKRPALAYEWSNYRLACSKVNARKNNFEDLLDPFEVPDGAFTLNILNGAIRATEGLPESAAARQTLARLKLDDGEMRRARLDLVDQYLGYQISGQFLRRESPFVWSELRRKGLLRPEDMQN